jgi:hypothetical protein
MGYTQAVPLDLFDEIWAILERAGLCDSYGSAEYFRLATAWCVAGAVEDPRSFIPREANRPPQQPGGERWVGGEGGVMG